MKQPTQKLHGRLQALLPLALLLGACAHQSTVAPSSGHIDQKAQIPTPVSSKPIIPQPVVRAPTLPPPRAKAKETTYTVVVNEVPVKEILFALARESKMNIDIDPTISGKATLNAVDQTMPAILERLARQVNLAYKIENNVLSISQDLPVWRTYKIDYVNINRDTTGFIGAASEIASTGRSASTGAGSTGVAGSSMASYGTGASNSSRTSVALESKHRLWESLVKNLKDLLGESDKEEQVTHTGSTQNTNTSGWNGVRDQLINEMLNSTDKNVRNNAVRALATLDDKTLDGRDATGNTSQETQDKRRDDYKALYSASVIANPETGIINVRATAKQHQKVQEFIDSVMRRAKRQVLIEATIVEVQLKDGYQQGIDWSRLSTSGKGFVFGQSLGSKGLSFDTSTGVITSGGPDVFGATTAAGLITGYLNPTSVIGNIAASITLLQQFGNTKVLSSPKLMVLNNQTAVLKVVDNLVYFTVQSQISQSSTVGGTNLQSITTTPNTVPIGVVMSVTPQINDTAEVSLDVRPTISNLLGYVQDPNPMLKSAGVVSQIPQVQVREMESVLNVASGNIAVLGGLMQDEIRHNTDAVPGVSKIPLVGELFTGRNLGNRKTELVIFIRPTVITNASLESDELNRYQHYLPTPQLRQDVHEPTN